MDAYLCPLVVFVLVPAFVVGIVILWLTVEGRRMQALCSDGIEAVAVVLHNELVVTENALQRRTITYWFSDAAGRTRTDQFRSTGGHEESLAGLVEGDPLSIVYLLNHPAVNRPKVVVDDHRAAFRKRDGRSR